MIERTPQTSQNVGQEAGPVAENYGQAGFGASILRKMADDGRRPNANGEIPVHYFNAGENDELQNGDETPRAPMSVAGHRL